MKTNKPIKEEDFCRVDPRVKVRASRRRRLYGIEAFRLKKEGRALLEERSIQRPAQKNDEKALQGVHQLLRGRSWRTLTISELDSKLAEHMQDMYFAGENNAAGSTLLAAVGWAKPSFARAER